ncbi:Hypothetical predicted protein [Octopus vulgaris]|uniref:Uncharacterized protein n=1 Tax=Octopus vulgaris TaxID=6645 RepID=A0AA36AHA8_OCTVU|nr:Hypothetical predicted protein [Octopus vulgaris]
MLLVKLKAKQCNISIIVCYKSINNATDEKKDSSYQLLLNRIDSITTGSMKILICELNAQAGSSNEESDGSAEIGFNERFKNTSQAMGILSNVQKPHRLVQMHRCGKGGSSCDSLVPYMDASPVVKVQMHRCGKGGSSCDSLVPYMDASPVVVPYD